jgi:sugar fermentation stimulation protein A
MMPPARITRTQHLVEGVLLRRHKRFLADVELASGGTVTAHCVNTGAMEGLTLPGTRVWLSRADNPARKLAFTWELAEIEGHLVGVNTALPNRLVGLLLAERRVPWLADWREMRAEKPYGERSRVDFWLRRPRGEHYLEVKNCHLVYPDRRAYFPDCVSARAAGHLRELAGVMRRGAAAEVMFVVQIPGVRAVRPSDVHDPAFAAAAREARRAGVRFSAIAVRHTPVEIVIDGRIPVELAPYPTARIECWRSAWRSEKEEQAKG